RGLVGLVRARLRRTRGADDRRPRRDRGRQRGREHGFDQRAAPGWPSGAHAGHRCPVGGGSPNRQSRCPGGAETGAGGYTYGDYARITGFPDVHADGEIWGETLWDLRRALIEHLGSRDEGARLAERLVTEGLRLTPPQPTMLDARDAILAADRA